MLASKGLTQSLELVTLKAEASREPGLEPTDWVLQREQVVTELGRVDDGLHGVWQPHAAILASRGLSVQAFIEGRCRAHEA